METDPDNEDILTDRQLKDFTHILLTGSLLKFTLCMLGTFFMIFCRLLIFFKIYIFE